MQRRSLLKVSALAPLLPSALDLNKLSAAAINSPRATLGPVLFVGHGSPTN